MRRLILALSLFGCVRSPTVLSLPPPASLPSESLLPEVVVAYPQPKGAVLIEDSVVMNPETAAAVAAELLRLEGMGVLYQQVERKQGALVLSAQAAEAQRVYKRTKLYEKWAAPAALTVMAVGFVAGVAITLQVTE